MKSTNGRYPTSQRVLVLNNHSLMGAGVERLLSNSGHLQIIGAASDDETDLVDNVWQFLPDVIIMSNQPSQLTPTRLLSLLKDYGSLRLIVVSEMNNSLEVYEKRRVETKRLADLTTAIHNHN